MKIIAADIGVLVLGLLVLGGAIGPFLAEAKDLREATRSKTGFFDLTFRTSEVDLETKTDSDMRGENSFTPYRATGNVSRMKVQVSCTDPATATGEFRLRIVVSGPNGTRKEEEKGCTASEIVVDVTPVPGATKVQADELGEARSKLPSNATSSKGAGTWSVTITGTRAGAGGGLPLPAGQPSGSVKLVAVTWMGELKPEEDTTSK